MKRLISLLFIFFITFAQAGAQQESTGAFIRERSEMLFPEAVKIRRHLHANPELGNREKLTTEFIVAYLRECGLEVNADKKTYGVKGVLRGKGTGPVVGIRADMDALPIEEENEIPFRSRNKGVMHACGHDVHMTNALIAAKIASGMRDHIRGTLVFIFQPCEEGPPPGEKGGASRMIEDGVLENPHIDAMIGLHIIPGLQCGTVGVREGPFMAGAESFYIDIMGKGAHGASPHEGLDALYIASLAVIEFQGIISRLKNPVDPAVLTVGIVEAGERRNVLARKAHLEGTVRTFSDEGKKLITERMEGILRGFRTAYGIEYSCSFVKESAVLINDPVLYRTVIPALERLLPPDHIINMPPQTIAEDFACFSHEIPSFFFFLGVGNNEKGYTSGLHTPLLMVDEEVLKVGPQLLLGCALERMASSNAGR